MRLYRENSQSQLELVVGMKEFCLNPLVAMRCAEQFSGSLHTTRVVPDASWPTVDSHEKDSP
jgi:hypothetical protein